MRLNIVRDEFPKAVKETLAKRVGQHCSNPGCRKSTVGPHNHPDMSVNVGVAAHITSAADGGPRYDPALTPKQRSAIGNAIWLCQTCAKLIDSDSSRYTVDMICEWKKQAESLVRQNIEGGPQSSYFPQPASAVHAPLPRIGGLDYDTARTELMEAGWQPFMNHWSYSNNSDIQFGNGLYFWNKGYWEIRSASGTGMSFCLFDFIDVYGNKLVVVTAGEVIDEFEAKPHVWSWHLDNTEEKPVKDSITKTP